MRLCITAIGLYLVVALALPLATILWKSLEGPGGEFVGLANYLRLLDSDIFRTAAWNTVFFTFMATVFKAALGMWLAVLLNRKFRLARVTRATVLLPFIVPGYALAQASIRDGALQDWIALKETMLKIADVMPEDKFAYRATPAQRTWGEQILHVAEANVNQIGRLGSKAVAPVINMKATSRTEILKALAEFHGVGRRFQRYGDVPIASGGRFTLVDDYGHHPAEMAATLAAARGAFPGRRILLAFQPHRFTRTRDLFEDFVKVLSTADELVLADVYPAGEAPIVAADGRSLARAIRVAGKVEPVFVEKSSQMRDAVLGRVRDGDVVVTMGAGSIGHLAPELALPAGAGPAD